MSSLVPRSVYSTILQHGSAGVNVLWRFPDGPVALGKLCVCICVQWRRVHEQWLRHSVKNEESIEVVMQFYGGAGGDFKQGEPLWSGGETCGRWSKVATDLGRNKSKVDGMASA